VFRVSHTQWHYGAVVPLCVLYGSLYERVMLKHANDVTMKTSRFFDGVDVAWPLAEGV